MPKLLFSLLSALWFICCCTISIVAQNPYFVDISKEKGLPSNNIYDIMEDSRGFKWVCSDEGLSRFDGVEFITYKSKLQSSYPGSCITEDRYGRIWYENFDGYLYYVKNDSLHALAQSKPIQYLGYGISSEKLFVLQEKGIDIYELSGLKKIKTVELLLTKIEHATVMDDTYIIISDDIIYRINDNFTVSKNNFFESRNEPVKQIYSAGDHLFVVSKLNERKTLYKVNRQLKISDSLYLPHPEFIQSAKFIDNSYWINTTVGTYIYDNNGNFKNHYYSSSNISTVLKDYQQNYWIGTIGQGIKIAPDLNLKLKTANGHIPKKIEFFDNNYLVASNKGDVIKVSRDLSRFEDFFVSSENTQAFYLHPDSSSSSIFLSSKGFSKIDAKNAKLIEIKNLAIKDLVRLDASYMAFSSSGLVGLLKTDTFSSIWDNIFNRQKHPEFNDISILYNKVRSRSICYNAADTVLYFGTNNGLFRYSLDSLEEIFHENEKIFAGRIICSKQKIYVMNTKGGLMEITKSGKVKNLNRILGFGEFDIKNLKYFMGKVYIFNSRYIYALNPDNLAIKRISPFLGGFDVNDFLIDGDNLIILTNIGIINFRLGKADGKIAPRFYINSVSAGAERINSNKILNYRENNINIHFSILEFGERNYEKLSYTVNNGIKTDIPDLVNRIVLPSLSAGNYNINFYIDGKKITQEISFTILPPWWKRLWFIFVAVAFSFTLGYLYYRYQTGLLRSQVKLLNEKVELEHNLSKSILTSIKSQMNPHFFYNALNTIQAFIFTNDKTKANSYLAKFSKLTRLILEQSELDKISLGDEINTLTLYLELEKMRFNSDFEYNIRVINIPLKDEIEIIPMLIQPYVENAVKHGLLHKKEDRKLEIIFKLDKDILSVTIDDNGIGRKKAMELKKIRDEKSAEFSTKANEKRLEILNKINGKNIGVNYTDKTDESGNSIGTVVILTIPIN